MGKPFLLWQVRHPACCGVAILDSSPSPSGQILPPLVSHRGHVIEYVDHGAYYYRHFFYTHGEYLLTVDMQMCMSRLSQHQLYHHTLVCHSIHGQTHALVWNSVSDQSPFSDLSKISCSKQFPLSEFIMYQENCCMICHTLHDKTPLLVRTHSPPNTSPHIELLEHL